MADLSSDPADLFASSLTIRSPGARALSPHQPRSKANFYILPPSLSVEQKVLYKSSDQSSLGSEKGVGLIEIIGEYKDGDKSYFFARHGNGLAHKFSTQSFATKYADLVKEYARKKVIGDLKPFDPSASYVHPASRIKVKVRLGTRGVTTANGRVGRHRDEMIVSGTEDEYEGGTEESDQPSDDEYESSGRQGRIMTRRTRHTKALPFSPRKSRLRRVHTIDDSDEDDGLEARPSLRRSKRTKTIQVAVGSESSSLSSDHTMYKPRSHRGDEHKKKTRRKKPIKPAYGCIHDVSDIEYESDDELRRHRDICEKCHERPAHELLWDHNTRSRSKSSRKKAAVKGGLDESEDGVEKLRSLGGWIRCLKCPVVAHWKCLSSSQRDEILKAMRDKDAVQAEAHDTTDDFKIKKRSSLDVRESTDFICGACTKGGICMGCMDVVAEPHTVSGVGATDNNGDIEMIDINTEEPRRELLFRCFTCRRPSHYEHLPRPSRLPEDSTVTDIAQYYQNEGSWLCSDCSSYIYQLDKILAWRPYPPNAVEPLRGPNELPNYKDPLPRQYLIKWVGRSYRRTQWVPHMWLLSTNNAKLKNFIVSGARVELHRDSKKSKVQEDDDLFGNTAAAPDVPMQKPLSLDAFPDAEQHIPLAWKTVDRVLDVLLWRPKSGNAGVRKKDTRVDSGDETTEQKLQAEYNAAFDNGEQPSTRNTETAARWESRMGCSISEDTVGDIVWMFVKWDDLNYGEATWDSPPRPSDPGYAVFVKAFARYVASRNVRVPKYTQAELRQFEDRPKDISKNPLVLKNATDLKLGQNPELQLLPFQIEGFNWLCYNWWIHQPCILADEMGLGKTIQIVTFLGTIQDKFNAAPALVVVPNSTITNWVREFERWAPNLRVVPYYGDAKAREIIREFELHHEKVPRGFSNAKFHVLVVTYEALLNKAEFSPVFKSEPRWEVLVIDEGQRLKNDTSMLFKKLNELKSGHRIIMTGTPLNNNVRELFNLMNFLDPENWSDLDALEKEYEELTEERVKELHNKLRPYFLRRIKSEVLELPPKNEVIVPVSMAPLQREVYRSILSHNVDTLQGLTQPLSSKNTTTKKNIHNILMQLRKCLQHPYLYDDAIEPRDLQPQEMHGKLIDASAKLRLLKLLLPKLKARGHRILLFSQFVIALNVIEDFLEGEGFNYLRLDGNTNSFERQKGMDEFNRPGSDVFMYLLSTRAGGVGINLYTADTVIIFDPDFNPHQDLQAISRAYRYGQQKTCLVFKLMVKDSAEERIMQIGKKKLVLDHLIVQKMDDDDSIGEGVQSILTFGAKALFEEEQGSRDIIYTEQDVDKLIEKTEQEGEKQEEVKEGAFSFSYAKVWAADKDAMEEVQDDDQVDSWTQTLQKINAERERNQIQEVVTTGRGARRAAASIKPNYVFDGNDGSPDKIKRPKSKSVVSETSSYSTSDNESDESEKYDTMSINSELLPLDKKKSRKDTDLLLEPSRVIGDTEKCGLCGQVHGNQPGECWMTDKSEYLAEFREMLIHHATDEPWEERSAAIKAIDETLHRRGHLFLIAGQPLHPLRAPQTMKTVFIESSTEQQGAHLHPGPLKRPPSPSDDTGKKKPKPSPPASTCPICNRSPHHLVKDCPVVVAGPQRYLEQSTFISFLRLSVASLSK
ncbi:hypothetical protein AX15_000900 [Amanita polypyramis BW_CC]|nr:hypothetical protein AX15_000900 [Amanita polypyramis BW_CC]